MEKCRTPKTPKSQFFKAMSKLTNSVLGAQIVTEKLSESLCTSGTFDGVMNTP